MSKYHESFISNWRIGDTVDYYERKRKTNKNHLGGFAIHFWKRNGLIIAKTKILPKEIKANTPLQCLIKVANALKFVKKKDLENILKLED
ncbi:MAG: hypothetical protein ACTSYD_02675 [Candidatus Heimdallarchaeaceae archaeon]